MKHTGKLTQEDLSQLAGLPVLLVQSDALPYPPSADEEPSDGEVRANAAALRRIVKASMQQDPRFGELRRLNTDNYRRMVSEEIPSCQWVLTNTPGGSLDDGPYTALHSTQRMAGIFSSRAAVMMIAPDTGGHSLLQEQLQMPAELIERTWPEYEGELRDMITLHELAHAVQGYTPIEGLYKNQTEQAFWYELDADFGALKWGYQLGMSPMAQRLMMDMRTLMAFNTAAKRYWFSPQLNGIEASYADTIAAHREIRAMTMLMLDGRDTPKANVLQRWAQGHDGERLVCRDSDVLNLRRSFLRLAEKLEARPDILGEDLQALAHLHKHHEFVLPLAQTITALTVDATRSFAPSLVT